MDPGEYFKSDFGGERERPKEINSAKAGGAFTCTRKLNVPNGMKIRQREEKKVRWWN